LFANVKRWGKDDDASVQAALVAARLSEFIVVGDAVLRRCDEPKLALFWNRNSDYPLTVGWRFTDFDMVGDQDGAVENDALRWPSSHTETGLFRLDRFDDALAFAKAWVSWPESGCEVSSENFVESYEASEIRSPDDILSFANGVLAAINADGKRTSEAVRTRRAALAAALADVVAGVDPAGLRLALDGLLAGGEPPGSIAADALRWRTVERSRDFESALTGVDHGDGDALASMF
jgi:hypothetical protein